MKSTGPVFGVSANSASSYMTLSFSRRMAASKKFSPPATLFWCWKYKFLELALAAHFLDGLDDGALQGGLVGG